MKNLSPRLFDGLALAAIVAAVLLTLLTSSGKPTATAPTNMAVRTEVQRYMGYEVLPVRYFSLPYDTTMNANEQLALLDIGFLLLAFVPIILLLSLREKPRLQWAVILSCVLLLIISTATGYISGTNLEQFRTIEQGLDGYLASTPFTDAPTGVLAATAYRAFENVYGLFDGLLAQISGERDAVTYPILLLSFVFFGYLGRAMAKGQPQHRQVLLAFLLVYSAFWLLLSSGIVWYGFLMFPLFTVLVFFALEKQKNATDWAARIARYGFFGLVGLTMLIGFAQRFSNIQLNLLGNDPMVGKRLYDPAYVKYQAGDLNKNGVMEAYYPGLPEAVREINAETKSLVYDVGTRFNFFIEENDRRIFKDNLLELFDQQLTPLKSKVKVTAQLRAWGFKYIMVDLNTPSGDKTPEQTLVERYKKFLLLLHQNPEIELMATDRVLQLPGGEKKYEYGMFGDAVSAGSYAVFRIK